MFRRTVLLAVLSVLAGTGEALAQKPTRKDALQERARQFYQRASPLVDRAAVAALVVVAESEPDNAAARAEAVPLSRRTAEFALGGGGQARFGILNNTLASAYTCVSTPR